MTVTGAPAEPTYMLRIKMKIPEELSRLQLSRLAEASTQTMILIISASIEYSSSTTRKEGVRTEADTEDRGCVEKQEGKWL